MTMKSVWRLRADRMLTECKLSVPEGFPSSSFLEVFIGRDTMQDGVNVLDL